MNTTLEVKGLEAGFGRKQVLRGFDLALEPGKVTVLMGRNGAGKSTLMRVLLGVLRPRAGTVRVLGQDPLRAHKQVLQQVGYVPDVPDVYPWMTAKDLYRYLEPHYPTWDRARQQQLCAQLDVPLKTRFKAMSRGQGMKAMLVAALAPEPLLLLLDEPFAGLDALVREEVLQGVIEALKDGERTVLCATHELEVTARIADRVAVLDDGRVVRHGSLAEMLGQDEPVQVPRALQQLLREATTAATAEKRAEVLS
ncbi:MAG: ABC transporter ATP-binding protein [Planctomycetes bacterium]|nr:ABC transporter ATP-binding protein [Planctomycetota bacterium]